MKLADDLRARDMGRWYCIALVLISLLVVQTARQKVNSILAENAMAAKPSSQAIPDAKYLKMFSLGNEQLLADCYWLAFIQYVGDVKAREQDHYSQAYDYLDSITELDPRFTQPYWFAAFVLGAEMKRPDLAAKLIERGLQANQDSWYMPFIAAVNQFLFAHDDVKAAKYYRQAAKYPGAPNWLERQAELINIGMPTLYRQINTLELVYGSSSDPGVKEAVRKQLIPLLVTAYKLAPEGKAKARITNDLRLLGVEASNVISK